MNWSVVCGYCCPLPCGLPTRGGQLVKSNPKVIRVGSFKPSKGTLTCPWGVSFCYARRAFRKLFDGSGYAGTVENSVEKLARREAHVPFSRPGNPSHKGLGGQSSARRSCQLWRARSDAPCHLCLRERAGSESSAPFTVGEQFGMEHSASDDTQRRESVVSVKKPSYKW